MFINPPFGGFLKSGIYSFSLVNRLTLHNGNCVKDSTPPIEIEVTCNTQYYQSTDFVGGWVDGCAQTMWKSTSYTANKPLPTDLYIQQVKYGYGISQRDPNSCIFCHHPADNAITSYKISKTKTESEQIDGGWISSINFNPSGIGFDMELMNGVSSMSFDSYGHTTFGDITNPVTSLTYTDTNGQEYNIKLKDCNNKHESWLSSNSSYIVPVGTNCSRNSGGGGSSGGGSEGEFCQLKDSVPPSCLTDGINSYEGQCQGLNKTACDQLSKCCEWVSD